MTSTRRLWIGVVAVVVVAGIGGTAGVREWQRRSARARQQGQLSRLEKIRSELFAEIQPVKVSNCELRRFGEPHDGGYPLCVNLLGAVKAGYSYGISGYDGWGCDVSRQLHVPVHQYDCFNLTEPSCPGGMPVFHGECIGTTKSTEDGRPFDTFSNQFANNGHATVPIVMKIDVEGAEWDSFLLAPDSVFSHIDQLDVEFHHVDDLRYVATMQRLKEFFYIAHVHYNNFSCDPALRPFPSWAFEVLLVSKRIGVSDGSPAAPSPGIDAPNNPEWKDCQAPAAGTR